MGRIPERRDSGKATSPREIVMGELYPLLEQLACRPLLTAEAVLDVDELFIVAEKLQDALP